MGKEILIHVGLDSSLDDQGLLTINCFINKTCGPWVTRSGQVNVPHEHLRSHLVTKHDRYHSAEELEYIFRSHPVMSLKDTTDFLKYTDTLSESWFSNRGRKDIHLMDSYHASSWSMIRDHFSRYHRRKNATADSEKMSSATDIQRKVDEVHQHHVVRTRVWLRFWAIYRECGSDYCFGLAIGILTYIIGKDAYGALRQNL